MGWLGWSQNHLAFLASLMVAFLSLVKSVDHHLLEYGISLETSRCTLISSHIEVFKALSLRLKVSTLLIGAG